LEIALMRMPSDRPTTGDEQTVLGPPLAAGYEAGVVLSGKYRLEALLGEGGMGAVWRATNVLLDLPVAIKLIRAGLDSGALRARLQLEARSAAKLGHPAIVRVYDVGESELGDPFIVMEHLCGETLAQHLLSQGRLPAVHAVQLLLPIIDALAMAHARGIVHRDLKPDNLMIALEEQHVRPKILDFGVAKLTDARDSECKLTQAGAVVGSPEYMSPEQARGQDDVDASTDIWSICVVLYEAVTGSAPFSAPNYNALLRSIVEDQPKPLTEQALGDEELWHILERGLHKDRAQRYAKISELGQALAGWLVSQGVTEDACGSSLDRKWLTPASLPLSSGQAGIANIPSRQSQASAPHDSRPGSTGIARGPFTATIRPAAGERTRSLATALAACALLGVSLLALFRSPPASLGTARAPAASTALATPAVAPNPILPARSAPPVQAPLSTIEVWPASSAQPATATKPEARTARSLTPRAIATNTPRAIATNTPRAIATNTRAASPAAASAAPVAPRPERPLDLMAPY
jgi:serine/threonine protein kinase